MAAVCQPYISLQSPVFAQSKHSVTPRHGFLRSSQRCRDKFRFLAVGDQRLLAFLLPPQHPKGDVRASRIVKQPLAANVYGNVIPVDKDTVRDRWVEELVAPVS